jgi:hypothetical protein
MMGVYTVKLKDGTEFLGQRGFWEQLNEGMTTRIYKVLFSKTIPLGRNLIIPTNSISYIQIEPKSVVKEVKNGLK